MNYVLNGSDKMKEAMTANLQSNSTLFKKECKLGYNQFCIKVKETVPNFPNYFKADQEEVRVYVGRGGQCSGTMAVGTG